MIIALADASHTQLITLHPVYLQAVKGTSVPPDVTFDGYWRRRRTVAPRKPTYAYRNTKACCCSDSSTLIF
jgi:hypothetical protein